MATVLVIEDEEGSAQLIRFKLKSSGLEVIIAEDGKAGVDEARKNKPDLIVLDVMMPVMNGLDVLAQLRADPEFKSTPIILLTAQSTEKEMIRGFELGAADYITKPFNTNVFVARVKALLSRYQKS